jgi:hypothetical protein
MIGFSDLCVHKCVAATHLQVHVVNVCVVARDYTTTQNQTFFRRLKNSLILQTKGLIFQTFSLIFQTKGLKNQTFFRRLKNV